MLNDEMRAWASTPQPVRTITIDRKDIVRFAVATRAVDPVHYDPEVARARGFRDVVAPDLFYISLRTSVYNLVPQDELHAEGTPARDLPPVAFTQAMAGETRAELHRPFVAGDEVVCTRVVGDMFEKEGRSGALAFVTYIYRYADADDRPFAIEHFTRIFR